jgi:predicted MPP superfamily phosphohydrolase
MPLEGRGAQYSQARRASEWVLSRAYRGGWPARLVRALGLQPSVTTHAHDVTCERWPAATRALRIAFASDFHAGPTTHPSLLEDAARALRAAAPDVLLLGGDYVFLDAAGARTLVPLLRDLVAPLGRFAVMGNHDLWARDDLVRAALEEAGFQLLVNEAVTLPAPFAHVSICGLDDPWVGQPDPAATFAGASDVRVLLMHAPEGITLVRDAPFDLSLCGHTHGGHIALPGGVPIVTSGPLSRRFSAGRYDVGGRPMIVSRGIGATESALRLFAAPDVLVVTLGGPLGASSGPAA